MSTKQEAIAVVLTRRTLKIARACIADTYRIEADDETEPNGATAAWRELRNALAAPQVQDGEVEAGEWTVSKLCREGDHGWCANRNYEECHCECSCHAAPPSQVGLSERLSVDDQEELREIIHAVESGAPVSAKLDDRRKAAALLRKLAASPPGLLEKLEAEVERSCEFALDWRKDSQARNEHTGFVNRLEALIDSEKSGS